jgi:hypothetical protein
MLLINCSAHTFNTIWVLLSGKSHVAQRFCMQQPSHGVFESMSAKWTMHRQQNLTSRPCDPGVQDTMYSLLCNSQQAIWSCSSYTGNCAKYDQSATPQWEHIPHGYEMLRYLICMTTSAVPASNGTLCCDCHQFQMAEACVSCLYPAQQCTVHEASCILTDTAEPASCNLAVQTTPSWQPAGQLTMTAFSMSMLPAMLARLLCLSLRCCSSRYAASRFLDIA